MKSVKEIFTTLKTLLKLIEVILCLIGLVFLEFCMLYYGRWTFEMLVIGLGGYLLICAVLFVSEIMEDGVPRLMNLMFMLIGAIINIIAAIFTMVRNAQRDKFHGWFIVSEALSDGSDLSINNLEIFVFIFSLAAGVVMLLDFILLLRKGGGGGE